MNSFFSLSYRLRRLRVAAVMSVFVVLGFRGTSPAQTIILSRAEHTPGSVDVLFTPTPGKICRIEHSTDLTNWTFYPDGVYGFGQQARYHVYDAPIPQASVPAPVSGEPRPSDYLFFMVNAFADGSAVASWAGQDGSYQKAYLSSFNLVYQNNVMQEMTNGVRVPASPALPYSLDVWSWSSPQGPIGRESNRFTGGGRHSREINESGGLGPQPNDCPCGLARHTSIATSATAASF